jgi:hypothetical protein
MSGQDYTKQPIDQALANEKARADSLFKQLQDAREALRRNMASAEIAQNITPLARQIGKLEKDHAKLTSEVQRASGQASTLMYALNDVVAKLCPRAPEESQTGPLEVIHRRLGTFHAMEAGRNREAARLRKDLAAAIQRAESAESWVKSWRSDVNDCADALGLAGQPMIPGCMKNAAEQLRDERDRAQAEVAQLKRDMQTREDQHWAEHNRIGKERDDFRQLGLKWQSSFIEADKERAALRSSSEELAKRVESLQADDSEEYQDQMATLSGVRRENFQLQRECDTLKIQVATLEKLQTQPITGADLYAQSIFDAQLRKALDHCPEREKRDTLAQEAACCIEMLLTRQRSISKSYEDSQKKLRERNNEVWKLQETLKHSEAHGNAEKTREAQRRAQKAEGQYRRLARVVRDWQTLAVEVRDSSDEQANRAAVTLYSRILGVHLAKIEAEPAPPQPDAFNRPEQGELHRLKQALEVLGPWSDEHGFWVRHALVFCIANHVNQGDKIKLDADGKLSEEAARDMQQRIQAEVGDGYFKIFVSKEPAISQGKALISIKILPENYPGPVNLGTLTMDAARNADVLHARSAADKPLYAHDCTACVFLGCWTDPEKRSFDLYFCDKPFRGDQRWQTVVARFGSDARQYTSGIGMGVPPLIEAERRARAQGLLKTQTKENP